VVEVGSELPYFDGSIENRLMQPTDRREEKRREFETFSPIHFCSSF